MLTLVSCPTCHHKFTIPEGAMGQRHTCPNCQSLFVAGKSVAESDGRIKNKPSMLSAGVDAGSARGAPLDKTMLGEMDPPIKYNCPRCKKPLEAPASEAGTKKPCPSCGGRLQVPAAAPRSAVVDPLNKTLLASAEGAAPPAALTPYSPAAPAAPVATVAPATATAAPARSRGWKPYAIGGAAAAVVALAVLFLMGKHAANVEQEKFLANRLAELDNLKKEIEQKSALLEQQRQYEAESRKQWQTLIEKQEQRQRDLDKERDRALAELNDQSAKAKAKAEADRKQRELDDEKKAAADQRAKAEQDLKNQIEALRRQVDNANKQTTIIQAQPPPVYPWYHYGRPYPWW
jgi:DNA-directed RNA polymerase subunit RPC12/RpoP